MLIGKNTLLKTEFATSNTDVNTFSAKDGGDDRGYAGKINLSNTKFIRKNANVTLNTSLEYEYVQSKFRPLERLRTVEFYRDWGLPLVLNPADENIIRAS